jgi:transposase-like protein
VPDDFLETFIEFEDRFATEEQCRDYLARLRWPDGFICPRCFCRDTWQNTPGLWVCHHCDHHASVTAGTLFQDTHKPLRLVCRANWCVTSQKQGASALGVQRELGLGSYPTAWSWLHELRRAMVRPGRDRLMSEIEVEETFVGGLSEGKRRRDSEGKVLVAIAAQRDGRKVGRIRLARIPEASSATLAAFVRSTIEPSSVVHTDGFRGYNGLEEHGYDRRVTVLRGKPVTAEVEAFPRVHLVASHLKRWLQGTHQWAAGGRHLDDYYLDEFAFRFNRRTSASRGKLFLRLMENAVALEPVTFGQIVGGKVEAPKPGPRESTE